MGESFIGGVILSCVQSFIYDISAGACNGLIRKYKQRKFLKETEKKIREFCLKNESLYIDSDAFRNFIDYHKPFDKVMQNAISMSDSVDINQLSNSIVVEAEEAAKTSNVILSVDDRRILKDLMTLVSNEITRYFQDVLDDGEKYTVSRNAQNTNLIRKDIKNVVDGNNKNMASIEKLMREANSISAYKAEPIAELICKKMWLGEFDEVESICQLAASKSNDLELAIHVLNMEMLESNRDNNDLKNSIAHIDNIRIRNTVIRNIIPLLYFRKEKFDELVSYTDSEYLKAIMSALNNDDYSYLFSMETELENGIELRKYTLNKKVMEMESWLVSQVFGIYMYNMRSVNAASLIESTIDAQTSWFSALIIYDKKTDMLAYEGPNTKTKTEMAELEEMLEHKKAIYDKLADDLSAVYYALIIKLSLVCGKNGGEIVKNIPSKLQHIHNHIIFNSTNLDCDRKFKNFFLSSFVIQRISDGLCLEHGLSVIKPKPYKERSKRTDYPKRESYRDKICDIIDTVLSKKPDDFDHFLRMLEEENLIIKRGKNPAVKMEGQKRFIRFRSLGDGYSVPDIEKIISGEMEQEQQRRKNGGVKPERKVDLLIDIQEKLAQGKGAGYERWAKVYNVKAVAKALLFLQQHDIRDIDD